MKSREPEAERLLVVQGQNDAGRRDVNSFQIEREKVVEAARPTFAAAQQRLGLAAQPEVRALRALLRRARLDP